MPNEVQTGNDAKTETFTKEQVQQMITDAVAKAKEETSNEFKDHIKKLNDENASNKDEVEKIEIIY
jgi:hypothetical protein